MLDVSDLIGIPYKENGRDSNGYDCYGLCIEVEKRLGRQLEDVIYENHDTRLFNEYLPTLNVCLTDNITEGTLLEMEYNGELHLAVALNNETMIHCTTNQGVKISPIYKKLLRHTLEVAEWDKSLYTTLRQQNIR